MQHIKRLYELSKKPIYGKVEGVCRITGEKAVGVPFGKWVKSTFTDWHYLFDGDIVSNEALLTFDEKSKEIQEKTGREKLQKFRTYSHFITGGEWKVYTKANKPEMLSALLDDATEMAVMAESGQKHLVFKHQFGYWQLEEMQVYPDADTLKTIHRTMQELLALGFNQTECIKGNYPSHKIIACGYEQWSHRENILKNHRGSGVFDIAAFLLFPSKSITIHATRHRSLSSAPIVQEHRPSIQSSLF